MYKRMSNVKKSHFLKLNYVGNIILKFFGLQHRFQKFNPMRSNVLL